MTDEILAKRVGGSCIYDLGSAPKDQYCLVDSAPCKATIADPKQMALFIYCDRSYVCIGSQGESANNSGNQRLQELVAKNSLDQTRRLLLVTGKAITKDSISFIESVLVNELKEAGWSQSNPDKKLDIADSLPTPQHSTSMFECFNIWMLKHCRRRRRAKKENTGDTYNYPDETPEILSSIWDVLHEIGCSNKTMPDGIRNLLISKYSPRLDLDSKQKNILNNIVENPNNNHIILGGAGTGKTLLLFKIATELDKQAQTVTDRDDSANGQIALILQGNFRDEGKDIEDQYHMANVGIYSIGSFTADVVKALADPTRDIRYSTILVDEGHGLPSFKEGKFGKTNNGFRTQWCKKYKIKDHTGNTINFSLSKYFKGELPGELKYSGEPVNDYIDFFHYLKARGIIRNVVICYDPDQWVYSGAIGRESDFQFSDEECKYHDIQFIPHRLEHQYRISPDGQDSDSGTNFVKGIRYFLQLDTDSNFNREVFRQDPQNTEAYFGIVNSIQELFDYVDEKKKQHPGSHNRVVAGYAVDWNKQDSDSEVWFDTDESGHTVNGWAWNDAQEGFVYDESSEERHRHQVGSIFAVQGQDLDYAGVIVARDIGYNGQHVHGIPENYKHSSGSIPKSEKDQYGVEHYNQSFDQQIRGIYYVLLTRGIHGVRVFFQDKALEKHFKDVMGIH